MKNLKIFAAIVLFALGTTLHATNIDKKVEKPTSIGDQIATLLQEPDFKVNEDVEATVTFIVNNDNELVVIDVDTQDAVVETFIKNRLNQADSICELRTEY